jgi:hypothetical protein
MSAPAQEPVPVNVLAVAQRVLGSPTGMEQTTELELVALAAFVVQANELPIEWPNWPLYGRATKASLAAAIAALLKADARLASANVAARDALPPTDDLTEALGMAAMQFEAAFNALKTRFNQEFPTNGNR